MDNKEKRSERYSNWLKDKRWKDKRIHIFKLREKKCMKCSSNDRLQVHHLKYTGFPWEAPDGDLITLCYKCHKLIHSADTSFTKIQGYKLIKQYEEDAPIRESKQAEDDAIERAKWIEVRKIILKDNEPKDEREEAQLMFCYVFKKPVPKPQAKTLEHIKKNIFKEIDEAENA